LDPSLDPSAGPASDHAPGCPARRATRDARDARETRQPSAHRNAHAVREDAIQAGVQAAPNHPGPAYRGASWVRSQAPSSGRPAGPAAQAPDRQRPGRGWRLHWAPRWVRSGVRSGVRRATAPTPPRSAVPQRYTMPSPETGRGALKSWPWVVELQFCETTIPQSETSARDRRPVLRRQTTVTFCYTACRGSEPRTGAV